MPNYQFKILKKKDIPKGFEIRNDQIAFVQFPYCHGCSSVNLVFKSGQQSVGSGYCETHNIGYILQAYCDLLEIDECSDMVEQLVDKPIRVAFKWENMAPIVDNTYIGHFMKDRWISLKTLFGRDNL